jgi:hypothetical protein
MGVKGSRRRIRRRAGLAFRHYPSPDAAERAIGEQRIYAALVLTGGRTRLVVARYWCSRRDTAAGRRADR